MRDLIYRVHVALNSIDKSLATIAKACVVIADVAEAYAVARQLREKRDA